MSEGDYVNAMKWYSQAIVLSPKDGALYSNRSFSFLRLKLTSRALEDADQALRLKPGWAKAHFRRAEALSQAGLHMEALEEYEAGAEIDPRDEHLRAQCDAARVRWTAASRREKMIAAVGTAIGVCLVLVLLLARPDGGGGGSSERPGLVTSIASVVVGGLLGAVGGVGTVLLLRYQRKGAVLPPLQTNEQFAAEQMHGDRDGAGELRIPKGRAADAATGSTAPTGYGTAPPAGSKDGSKEGKARVRSTGNGRAAALKALGKQK